MNDNVVYVGLDYHQDVIQACVLDRAGNVLANRPCANAWRDVVASVPGGAPAGARVHASIEASCGSANLADELMARAAWRVDLAHPGYVNRLKQSPDKTDFSDARLLADLTRVGYLPRVWLASEPIRQLRALVRYRQALVRQRRSAKQQIRALLRQQRLRAPGGMNPWTKAWLAWVGEQAPLGEQGGWIAGRLLARLGQVADEIKAVEKRLEQVTADDPIVARLRTMPAVGLVTAVTLRAMIGRFDRFATGKQLARFCGLSPRNASSGARVADAGLVAACDRELRACVIEAAHRLMRLDARWSALANQLRARGKKICLVAAAIGNRWLRWLYHAMKETEAGQTPPPAGQQPESKTKKEAIEGKTAGRRRRSKMALAG